MGTSMSEEQAQFIQAGVDECHEQFKATVCAFRKIDDDDMQGQVFYGTDAKARGLVDEIVSGLDEVFSISSALVDNSFMGMSNIVDPTPAPSAEANGELDSAVARVSELESQLESAQGRIADLEKALDESGLDSVKAQLDEANARVEELEAFDASNEAEIADLKSELVSLQEDFDAKVEARAKDLAEELAEQKAASIAARAGTEPLAVSGDSAGGVEESEFASMTSEQKWAHCAQIADADEKRAFYLKHLSH